LRSTTHGTAWLALFAVWFFWGTTYLGIRMALESFPPFTLICIRFLCSGIIMLGVARLKGIHPPSGRELWMTARNGLLLLGGGTGLLVVAEQWVPSGTAALIITLGAFWMVGMEALLPGGEKLQWRTMAGIVIGFLGVGVLVGPSVTTGEAGMLAGFLVLQVGCLSWCFGSILQRRLPTQAHPVISAAVQQLATGLVFIPIALLAPQHPIQWSTRGSLALVWLIVFGSIIGYSAFIYTLEHLPIAIVSTYHYVNPVVAVFLGWLIYREPFGQREIVAMMFVFLGVGVVKYFSGGSRKPPSSLASPQTPLPSGPAHSSAPAASTETRYR